MQSGNRSLEPKGSLWGTPVEGVGDSISRQPIP